MLRSLTFIKTVHSLAFFVLTVANLIVLYSAVTGQTSPVTWIALAAVLVEGVVLMLNGWRCPLRIYAEKAGAVSGQVTDIFLPKWFADRVFPICGGMLAFSGLLFAIRLLTGTLQ
jgi:hypothetical protein